MAWQLPQGIVYRTVPPSPTTARAALSRPVRSWFSAHVGEPTAAQRHAWPAVAAGENLLLAAPTGSGKTLAALLPVLDRLRAEPQGPLRCLYVAPLKALCGDVQRNLSRYIDGDASPFAALRVALRTGDTGAAARRELFVRPPQLLITTPESLAVLLTRPEAPALFAPLRLAVVDEVHALAGDKRGADLSLSLERLEQIASHPLQRVGLSATCAPLETVARFLVGVGRPCAVASVPESAGLEIAIEPLKLSEEGSLHPQRFFSRFLRRLDAELTRGQTLLIFCNTRKLAERVAWSLRRRRPDLAKRIAVHHSSLSKARRRQVEGDLKQGELRAVIATSSLELGIDLGAVDLVVLIRPPREVVQLLQRVGRSGHGPGRSRRGLIVTGSAGELLEAAVCHGSSSAGQIEAVAVPPHPLDVLCQQLLGMAVLGGTNGQSVPPGICPDAAFALVRRAYPYRELSRKDFDACLDYLSGSGGDGQPWLAPRISWEGGRFRVADGRSATLLRRNLGTILSEEMCPVRLADGSALGELDPGFADRLLPGDRFVLDGRTLQVRSATHRSVVAVEVSGMPLLPRWGSEGQYLARELARRLYVFRTLAAEALLQGPEALAALLAREYGLGEEAVSILVGFFQEQQALSEIPQAPHLLVEAVHAGHEIHYFLHTPLNRPGNEALGRAAELRLRRAGLRARAVLAADLGLVFAAAAEHPLEEAAWRVHLSADGFAADLQAAVADSELLRGRFARVAATGLLVLQRRFGGRRAVGGLDEASRWLFDRIRAANDDFVLLRQARREVFEVCLDAEAAGAFLADLRRGTVRVRWLPCISPFAEAWSQMAFSTEEPPEDLPPATAQPAAALPLRFTFGAGED